ncbi:hypothetical protein [Lysinibacillus sp. C5.1]|uniref:hypothetical protein n=1 Tax=Lysinibacillus sp. C5.1 TaxID=2796169 RepID=UPI0030813D98
MAEIKGITIELGLGDKSKLKLRAIAKHVSALADELDAIDNAELHDGKPNYSSEKHYDDDGCPYYDVKCHKCGISYSGELPTQKETTISIVNPNNKSVEDIVNTLKEQIKGND